MPKALQALAESFKNTCFLHCSYTSQNPCETSLSLANESHVLYVIFSPLPDSIPPSIKAHLHLCGAFGLPNTPIKCTLTFFNNSAPQWDCIVVPFRINGSVAHYHVLLQCVSLNRHIKMVKYCHVLSFLFQAVILYVKDYFIDCVFCLGDISTSRRRTFPVIATAFLIGRLLYSDTQHPIPSLWLSPVGFPRTLSIGVASLVTSACLLLALTLTMF